jgi:hypothetical protein
MNKILFIILSLMITTNIQAQLLIHLDSITVYLRTFGDADKTIDTGYRIADSGKNINIEIKVKLINKSSENYNLYCNKWYWPLFSIHYNYRNSSIISNLKEWGAKPINPLIGGDSTVIYLIYSSRLLVQDLDEAYKLCCSIYIETAPTKGALNEPWEKYICHNMPKAKSNKLTKNYIKVSLAGKAGKQSDNKSPSGGPI